MGQIRVSNSAQAVKDAYSGLKALLVDRLKASKPATTALEGFEEDPDTWRKPLEKTMSEAQIGTDAVVVKAAHDLLRLVQPDQAAKYKFNVTTGTVQGQQIGDFGTQNNAFGTLSKS